MYHSVVGRKYLISCFTFPFTGKCLPIIKTGTFSLPAGP